MTTIPIRWKFACLSAALVGVVLVVFAGATFLNLYHEQLEAVDLELERAGRHLASLAETAVLERTLDELAGFQPWLFAAVFDANGRIVRRANALPEPIARAALRHRHIQTEHDPSGQGWRVTSFPRGETTVALAFSLVEVDEIIEHLLIAFGLSLPVVLLVAAFGGWWVSGRALVTLRDLTTSAESIRADQLHQRIAVPAAKDEIHRLVDVLNTMLGRLESSFSQAKRFAADASHELRTPLTIIGGETNRLVRVPNLPPEAEALALSVQEEVRRLQHITEQMLLLAQFDAGTANIPHVDVSLGDLLREACDDAELLAEAADLNLTIRRNLRTEATIRGDPTLLRRLFLNLLDNAVRYNRPDGMITCSVSLLDTRVLIVVSNTGDGISAECRANLFQRFFRSDAARSRGGHGLGLSLCHEIVRAHGGEIALAEPQMPGWTEFTVSLPRHDRDDKGPLRS